MIYMGVGGDWSPNAPLVDILISKRLKARGYQGTRDGRACLYGSTLKSQALDYARNGEEAYLKVLGPQPGAIVAWVPGMKDMLLEFGSYMDELRWNGATRYKDVTYGALVRDIAGDLDIAETYLRLGRQKRAIGAMIDGFLDRITVCEHVLTPDDDILDVLEGHEGEMWLTGPCLIHDYDAALHAAPLPHQPTVAFSP